MGNSMTEKVQSLLDELPCFRACIELLKEGEERDETSYAAGVMAVMIMSERGLSRQEIREWFARKFPNIPQHSIERRYRFWVMQKGGLACGDIENFKLCPGNCDRSVSRPVVPSVAPSLPPIAPVPPSSIGVIPSSVPPTPSPSLG
jgi:hypothetical protein